MMEAHPAMPMPMPPADTAHIHRKKLDIAYAALSPAQKLDIYWPDEGEGPFPAIVAIHGGAFMGGDKGTMQIDAMLHGVRRGYAVVAINYRMSGEARFPALVHDGKAAVRWLRAHSQELRIDPGRIAVWGESAGGYLASMLGVTGGVAELEDLLLGNVDQDSRVQAAVIWYGPADFLKMDEDLAELGLGPTPGQEHSAAESPESLILGAQITEIPERVHAADPQTYVRPGIPPFLLQHGKLDGTVPYLQSVRFAEKLRKAGGRVELDLLEGAKHADWPIFLSQGNIERVVGWLDTAIRG
jgi:acetyl esterase/lipase